VIFRIFNQNHGSVCGAEQVTTTQHVPWHMSRWRNQQQQQILLSTHGLLLTIIIIIIRLPPRLHVRKHSSNSKVVSLGLIRFNVSIRSESIDSCDKQRRRRKYGMFWSQSTSPVFREEFSRKTWWTKKQEKSLFYLATFSLSNIKQLIKSQPITNLIQHNQKVQVCKLHKCWKCSKVVKFNLKFYFTIFHILWCFSWYCATHNTSC